MASMFLTKRDKAALKLHLMSSSHFSQFAASCVYGNAIHRHCSQTEAETLAHLADLKLAKHFPSGTACSAFGGLILGDIMFPVDPMDFTSQPVHGIRLSQQRKLRNAIQSSDREVAVQASCANNLKSMTIMNGVFVPVSEVNFRKWSDLPIHSKIKFSPRRKELLPRDYVKFIKAQVRKYCDHLEELYFNSNFKVVFHLSPLERQFVHPRFSLLKTIIVHQAYIDYFLQQRLHEMDKNKVTLNNKNQPIRWKYINVRDSFHKAKDSKKLFRPSEQLSGKMIHRNNSSLAVIREKMLKCVHRELLDMDLSVE